MNKSMQHFAGNQLCAIDTETTGFDSTFHEICQFSVIPLDANIKPRTDVLPFDVIMKLDYPERAHPEAMRVNRRTVAELQLKGFDRLKVIDMFVDWVDKLGLPYKGNGDRKQIIPLGQNYSFDKSFMEAWMGHELYREIFHYHYRDTMHAAAFLNDRAAMHGETVPYSKINLSWLASKHNVEHDNAHNSLEDARITSEVYRKLLMSGLLG